MAVGGFFVLLGVWSLGWRVIRTVGSKIATVDFHTAWCIEFGSTLSVVIARCPCGNHISGAHALDAHRTH